jgi:hypothetical protein
VGGKLRPMKALFVINAAIDAEIVDVSDSNRVI